MVPKLLHPKRRNHPDQVSAVGESIAPSGARVPTVERGDIDQHQLEPARVLGASTAGMLITMDAWRELGGFNPEVPLFRDGVELGWRANALGMVVRTWPQASLRHVEAGRVGLRESVLAPDSIQADQAAGMSVAVIHAEKPARTIRRLGAQSVVQAFGYLLGKSPSCCRPATSRQTGQAELRRPCCGGPAEPVRRRRPAAARGLLPAPAGAGSSTAVGGSATSIHRSKRTTPA